jgi:hypothetical protein
MEQRETHRNFVKELKEKVSSNLLKRFDFKDGKLCRDNNSGQSRKTE